MNGTDVIVIAVIAVIIGAITFYIIKQKKNGCKCIGCPYAKECSKKGCSCDSMNDSENE